MIKQMLIEAVKEVLSEESQAKTEGPTERIRKYGDDRKIVRCYSSGVFFARVESLEGRHAVLRDAKRIHKWDGAASLSEIAERGTSKPANCRIPMAMRRIEVTDVLEVIDTTQAARNSLDSVKEWTSHD